MAAPDILFWLFSAALLCSGLLVIFNRSPVASALSLVLLFFFQACLFVLLHAYFLAIVHILVYAGAVMVLFLFVIMLLDARAGRRWWFHNRLGLLGGALAGAGFLGAIFLVLRRATWDPPEAGRQLQGNVREVVQPLFSHHMLAFEICGLLLLVATIGIVLLGRKHEEPSP
jgi:NADH-quinone oxidoreductase subunit J